MNGGTSHYPSSSAAYGRATGTSGLASTVPKTYEEKKNPLGSTGYRRTPATGTTAAESSTGLGRKESNQSYLKTSSLLNTTKPGQQKTSIPSRQNDSSYGAFGIKKRPDEKDFGTSSSSLNGTAVGRHQRLAFGDNYGNARDFTRPDEEKKESTKKVTEIKSDPSIKLGMTGKAHSH